MSPTLNLSDETTVKGYVNNTKAELNIKSVTTDLTLKFPAFLTNFSQTFDATWNTEEVFGRMDPIATYQGTKRTMSLAFDFPAGTLKSAKNNLKGCSYLVRMVYPVYNSQNILVKPPLVRVTFGNLIKGDNNGGLLGWISGLSWNPNLEMGMFTENENFFPKVIALSFSFNILHEFTPNQNKENFPFGE